MQPSERFFAAGDGRKLFCRFWSSDRPRALLLIFHGIGEHGGRYRPLAEYLASRGISVMAPDQRGAGLSRNDRESLSHYAELLEDVPRIIDEGRRWMGGLPLILAGHSLGALTVLKFFSLGAGGGKKRGSGFAGPSAGCGGIGGCPEGTPHGSPHRIQGMIFSSPALRSRIPWLRLLGVRILGRFFRRFRLTFDAGSSYLSHDPLQVEAHRRDPLINHRFTAGFLRDVLEAMDDVRREVGNLPCPALVLYAGDDHLVDSGATRRFVETLSGDKESVRYEGAYHEIFNEVNREEVYARMAAWIDRVLSLPQTPPEDPHPQVKT